MNLRMCLISFLSLLAIRAVASDSVQYYQGNVRYTAVNANHASPPNTELILKREILPSKNQIIETATMDWGGKVSDLKTVVNIVGSTATVVADSGNMIGTGHVQGPAWNWNYFEMNFVVVPTGTTIKDINVIAGNQLAAWKEIRNSSGELELLWESDLGLISADEFQSEYAKMHSHDGTEK